MYKKNEKNKLEEAFSIFTQFLAIRQAVDLAKSESIKRFAAFPCSRSALILINKRRILITTSDVDACHLVCIPDHCGFCLNANAVLYGREARLDGQVFSIKYALKDVFEIALCKTGRTNIAI